MQSTARKAASVELDKQLDVLHDHYKESFGRVRELERSRDRNFLWLIVLYALLALQVGYPKEFQGSIQDLSFAGGEIALGTLPRAALLSSTWAMTLAITLRYCQAAVAVDRQYPYVHFLEENISPMVGGNNLYKREGYFYLTEYPTMLNVAWISYVMIFPILATSASVLFVCWEWKELQYPLAHQIFDSIVAASIVGCFFILRVIPKIQLKIRDWLANRKGICPD
jgi:hypothetical protein